MTEFVPLGLGWHPDVPDHRDYTDRSSSVIRLLRRLPPRPASHLQSQVDLREFFPPARNQLSLNASTAHACLALAQYFDRRVHGRISHPSHMFLYAMVRKLLRAGGNAGASLRLAFQALVAFGSPPEIYWPYETARLDQEPERFLYSYNKEYAALIYLRLDHRDDTGAAVLDRVKGFLDAGFPVAFGFSVPSSLSTAADIPYRPQFDSVQGGQAVVAVGYDDDRLQADRGALLIRSSWGSAWGDSGYGWLPYGYVRDRLALDFWTAFRPDWLETGEFFRPALSEDS